MMEIEAPPIEEESEELIPPQSLVTKPIKRDTPKIRPNDPCPCGSGKKYKNCHG